MLIDWFTVVAQIINLSILIFLLHRFLYRPIVNTIKSRQQEIDRRWQEAEEQKQVAELEAANYQQKQQQLEQEKREIIAQAHVKAEHDYHNLIEQARQDVEQQQAAWENAIAGQQEQFLENLQQKVTEQVHQIARHALQELADVNLEEQAIATFIHRLETLDKCEQRSLVQSLRKSNEGMIIRSSFELPLATREKIINALHQQKIYQGNNVKFATTSDLICGIELQASDYKVAWNLKRYLQSLEEILALDFLQNGQKQANL